MNSGVLDNPIVVNVQEQCNSGAHRVQKTEMDNDDEAYAAIEALNESEIDGRNIVVKKANPRPQRDDRDRRPRSDYNRY